MQNKLEGLVAAPFTPMHEDGSINLPQIKNLVDHYVSNQLAGIFVCGSTGEGPSMQTEERMQVAEAFMEAAAGRLFVFVHVGHSSLSEARKLAAHAQEIGANAISATLPTYFKITTEDILIQCLQEIAGAAPELPFYYYNIPILTGVQIDMVSFLDRGHAAIPNLAGIKFTSPLLHDFQACLAANEQKFDMLYGTDEMFLPALAVGAKGFIGSTYNFAAPVYHKIREAYETGNTAMARQHQDKIIALVRLLVKYGVVPSQKAIMKMIGLDCGPVRLPLQTLSKAQEATFQQELEAISFFEWSKAVTNV